MGKTTTICFTNNKGGSGKSTTCSNLGAAMARDGKKVLLVDGDMQLNLSLDRISGGLGPGTRKKREKIFIMRLAGRRSDRLYCTYTV